MDEACFDLLGTRVRVAGPRGLLEEVARRLPPLGEMLDGDGDHDCDYSVTPCDAGGFQLHRRRRASQRVPDLYAAAFFIVADLERALAHRGDLALLHAGAVAWRGAAIVLPGRSRSGKSELVSALLAAGAELLSDELAVLDREGRVHPYARPIARRSKNGLSAPAVVEPAVAPDPLPVGLIAFLRYRPQGRWRPRALSPGEALLSLLRHALAARRHLDLLREVLLPVARAAPAVRSERGEADEAASHLLAISADRSLPDSYLDR